MPKKKPSKKSDQPELPLDAAAAVPGQRDIAQNPKNDDVPISLNGNGEVAAEAQQKATIETAPRRKPGEKVQDEQAPLAQSYRNWFLDYASYVILDRAVPHLDDGLKPVQRRILHTLWEMDDGRFHKVANVVGRTMSLHQIGRAHV